MQAINSLAVILLVVTVSGQESTQSVDLTGTAIQSFSELTKQINQIQELLSQLNGLMTKMVTLSTRLIISPENSAQSDSNSLPDGFRETITTQVQHLPDHLSQIKFAISQMTRQLQYMRETSARMIAQPQFYQNVGITQSFNSWSMQLKQMDSVLRSMSKQWNHLVKRERQLTPERADSIHRSPRAKITLPTFLPGAKLINQLLEAICDATGGGGRILTELQVQLTRMTGSVVPSVPVPAGADTVPAGPLS